MLCSKRSHCHEKPAHRNEEYPCSLQLEKACVQQQRPSIARSKINKASRIRWHLPFLPLSLHKPGAGFYPRPEMKRCGMPSKSRPQGLAICFYLLGMLPWDCWRIRGRVGSWSPLANIQLLAWGWGRVKEAKLDFPDQMECSTRVRPGGTSCDVT